MAKRLHTILNEKYRPDTLEGYICKEDTKQKFDEFIKQQDIPHLLFAGKPGAGKTTIAKILVKNIDCDYLYINATDERSIDVMRDKVGAFAAAGSFKPLKIVILDEATHILQAGQVILLNMMETYSLTTRFILTGNYPERLIDPLRSRCQEFDLAPPSKKVIAQHISVILDKEDIKYEIPDLVTIVNKYFPDFRKIINNCQKYTIDGALRLDTMSNSNDDYKDALLAELKKPLCCPLHADAIRQSF
jgi:replication factor C small subunit